MPKILLSNLHVGARRALATGLFATKTVNAAGADGLFYGNPQQFLVQLGAAALAIVFSMALTWLLAKLTGALVGLRVSAASEQVGLDISEHGERSLA
ncbi:MAG: hypothetical protein R6X16_04265 [Anaerolineae bacterium]